MYPTQASGSNAQTPDPQTPNPQAQYQQAQYQQAQYPAGAGWKPGPVGPATALPRTAGRGPGGGAVGVVVAVTLLTFAGLLYAQRVSSFDGPVALTTGAVAVTLLGLGVIIAGLRGRTGGGMGVLAVLLAVALVPMAAFDAQDWESWDGSWDGESIAVGDIERTPTTVAEATDGYRIGAGDIDIDLTEVPLGEEAVTVPITLGAGDLVVVVPAGVGFDAQIDVRAGEVDFLGGDGRADSGRVIGQTYESPALEDGEPLQLHLDISVGAGTVTIEEAGR